MKGYQYNCTLCAWCTIQQEATINQQLHPTGVVVEIVGINQNGNGRSCEEHNTCGTAVVMLDTVLRLQKVQVINGKRKEHSLFAVCEVICRSMESFSLFKMMRRPNCFRGMLRMFKFWIYVYEVDCWLTAWNFNLWRVYFVRVIQPSSEIPGFQNRAICRACRLKSVRFSLGCRPHQGLGMYIWGGQNPKKYGRCFFKPKIQDLPRNILVLVERYLNSLYPKEDFISVSWILGNEFT